MARDARGDVANRGRRRGRGNDAVQVGICHRGRPVVRNPPAQANFRAADAPAFTGIRETVGDVSGDRVNRVCVVLLRLEDRTGHAQALFEEIQLGAHFDCVGTLWLGVDAVLRHLGLHAADRHRDIGPDRTIGARERRVEHVVLGRLPDRADSRAQLLRIGYATDRGRVGRVLAAEVVPAQAAHQRELVVEPDAVVGEYANVDRVRIARGATITDRRPRAVVENRVHDGLVVHAARPRAHVAMVTLVDRIQANHGLVTEATSMELALGAQHVLNAPAALQIGGAAARAVRQTHVAARQQPLQARVVERRRVG